MLCDFCVLIKTKTNPVSKAHDLSKRSNETGETLFSGIARLFLTEVTSYHKETKNNLFWNGVSDQFSTRMITCFQHSKTELTSPIEESFKCFKHHKKNVKCVRMDD